MKGGVWREESMALAILMSLLQATVQSSFSFGIEREMWSIGMGASRDSTL